MEAISLSIIQTLLQTKHCKEQVINILDATMGEYCKHSWQNMFMVIVWLLTNIGKEQLFNILHTMGEKVEES
jgi:ferric iron reductase protein FhuF